MGHFKFYCLSYYLQPSSTSASTCLPSCVLSRIKGKWTYPFSSVTVAETVLSTTQSICFTTLPNLLEITRGLVNSSNELGLIHIHSDKLWSWALLVISSLITVTKKAGKKQRGSFCHYIKSWKGIGNHGGFCTCEQWTAVFSCLDVEVVCYWRIS